MIRTILGYFCLAVFFISLGFAVYYGTVAGRFEDKRRFAAHRWLAFFFPARWPDEYVGTGYRFVNRRLVALLAAVLALLGVGLLAPGK